MRTGSTTNQKHIARIADNSNRIGLYALLAEEELICSLVRANFVSEADKTSGKDPDPSSLLSLSFLTNSGKDMDIRLVLDLISSSSLRPKSRARSLAYFEHAQDSTCRPFGSLIRICRWLACSSRIP